MALNFQRDTIEYFEKKYMPFIINEFPEYAKFWEENIGTEQRDSSGKPQLSRILSYNDGQPVRSEIERIRKQISQAHYSQFIHMIGVKREMNSLICSVSLSGISTTEKFFEIWFPFFNVYTHLSSIIDLEMFLWRSLYRLNKSEDWQHIAQMKDKRIIQMFNLEKKVPKIAGVYNSISSIRNVLIHWTRVPVNLDVDPPIFIFPIRPLQINEEPPLWEETIDKGVVENPLKRTKRDWQDLLDVIRKLRLLYLDEIRDYMKSNNLIFKEQEAQQIGDPKVSPPSGAVQANFAVTGSQEWQKVHIQSIASGSTTNHK